MNSSWRPGTPAEWKWPTEAIFSLIVAMMCGLLPAALAPAADEPDSSIRCDWLLQDLKAVGETVDPDFEDAVVEFDIFASIEPMTRFCFSRSKYVRGLNRSPAAAASPRGAGGSA